MKTWPTKKLGEVLDKFDRGISWSKKDETSDADGMPVLRIPNILLGEIIKDDLKYIKISQPREAILEKEDIVMVASNGNPNLVARSALVTEGEQRMLFASFLVRLRFNQNKILSRYVHLFFQTTFFKKEVRRKIATTSGIYNLKKEHIERLQIPYPPLVIQYKIIERLDAIRKAQDLNDKQIALADELFQSLLNKELALEGTDRKINKLEEVAEIIMGQSPPSSTYNTERNGLPFLQGKFEFGEIYPIPIKFCSQPLRIAKKNDVLLSVRAPVGPVNLAPSECCIGRGLSAIRAKAEKLDQLFLFYFMKLNEERMSLLGCGSTFNAIGRDHIEKIKISLPPLEIQRQIVAKLQAAHDYKKKLLEQKQKLQELFNSCLDKAMKGELVN